jgi:hypothetical protein
MRFAAIALALAGCGRISFDTRSDAGGLGGGDVIGGDAATFTVTFGDNPTDTYQGVTADTELLSLMPGQNFGASTFIAAGVNATFLLRFDLSQLTPSAPRVVAATLHLMGDDGSVNNAQMTVHRVREAWTEGTQAQAPGVANWNQRTAVDNWTMPGAAPPSRDSTAMGMFTYQTFMPETVSLDVTQVQDWIDTPATNFGMVLTSATLGGTMLTRESTGMRPQLELVLAP